MTKIVLPPETLHVTTGRVVLDSEESQEAYNHGEVLHGNSFVNESIANVSNKLTHSNGRVRVVDRMMDQRAQKVFLLPNFSNSPFVHLLLCNAKNKCCSVDVASC